MIYLLWHLMDYIRTILKQLILINEAIYFNTKHKQKYVFLTGFNFFISKSEYLIKRQSYPSLFRTFLTKTSKIIRILLNMPNYKFIFLL